MIVFTDGTELVVAFGMTVTANAKQHNPREFGPDDTQPRRYRVRSEVHRRWPMKGHSATSNLSLPEWVDLHERRDAALWKLCYPRNYRVDNHYSSPRQLGAERVGIRVAIDYRDRVPLNERMMLDHSILAGARLVKLRVPSSSSPPIY